MGSYNRTYSFTDGTTAYGSQLAFELDALGSSVNNIVNAQISSGAAIADSKLAQISTASKVSGAALTSLASIPSGAGVIPAANLTTLSGQTIQTVYAVTNSAVTSSTVMPDDDSIPQNTEGTQILTCAITPNSASNTLVIILHAPVCTSSSSFSGMALFQDSTAGALAAVQSFQATNAMNNMVLIHKMTAGTTSSTTFKMRIGPDSGGGTLTINGQGGSRRYGGVSITSITIMEIKA